MKRAVILITILLLAGCAPLAPVPSGPTSVPETQATLPPEADDAAPAVPEPSATSALLPTLAGADPLAQPGETGPPTPALTIPGIAEIAILRPGQLSRHASPIRILASLSNPDDSRVTVTLYGEDSGVLAQRIFDVLPYQDPVNGNVILDMDFQIEGLAEAGRLEFKVYDPLGRLRALNSVSLILLSLGITDRNYAPEDGERILLQVPFPGQTEVEGGQLLLSGLVRLTPPPANSEPKPLTVQLVGEQGEILGEGRAPVILTPGSAFGQFVAEIAYQVEAPTRVLLTIGIEEGRLPGFTYVKTFPLILNP